MFKNSSIFMSKLSVIVYLYMVSFLVESIISLNIEPNFG